MNNELQFLIYDTPEEGELEQKVVISTLETTMEHDEIEGKIQTKATRFYNLDAIIPVGYRVNSKKLPDKKAKAEYDEFNKTQKINSDFEKEVKKFLKKGGGNNE